MLSERLGICSGLSRKGRAQPGSQIRLVLAAVFFPIIIMPFLQCSSQQNCNSLIALEWEWLFGAVSLCKWCQMLLYQPYELPSLLGSPFPWTECNFHLLFSNCMGWMRFWIFSSSTPEGPRKGWQPPKGPLWHEDTFELKSNSNPTDSGEALYVALDCLERIYMENPLQKESYHHRYDTHHITIDMIMIWTRYDRQRGT